MLQVRIQRADPARILLNVDDIPHTTNRALKLAQRELELSRPEDLDSSSSSSSGDTKNRMWLRMQGTVIILTYDEGKSLVNLKAKPSCKSTPSFQVQWHCFSRLQRRQQEQHVAAHARYAILEEG